MSSHQPVHHDTKLGVDFVIDPVHKRRNIVSDEAIKAFITPQDEKAIQKGLEKGTLKTKNDILKFLRSSSTGQKFDHWRTRGLKTEGIERSLKRVGRSAAVGLSSLPDLLNLPALGLYALGLKKEPEFFHP
jgi:hypothetical protein